MTCQEDESARPAITTAKAMSGQPVSLAKTPAAAIMKATLLIASLQLHSQTERMLLSPSRKLISSSAQRRFTDSAAKPTTPMV